MIVLLGALASSPNSPFNWLPYAVDPLERGDREPTSLSADFRLSFVLFSVCLFNSPVALNSTYRLSQPRRVCRRILPAPSIRDFRTCAGGEGTRRVDGSARAFGQGRVGWSALKAITRVASLDSQTEPRRGTLCGTAGTHRVIPLSACRTWIRSSSCASRAPIWTMINSASPDRAGAAKRETPFDGPSESANADAVLESAANDRRAPRSRKPTCCGVRSGRSDQWRQGAGSAGSIPSAASHSSIISRTRWAR